MSRRTLIGGLAVLIATASLVVSIYGSLLYETAAAVLALSVAGLIAWAWRSTNGRHL